MVVIELNAPVEQYEDAVYVSGELERYFRALKDEALKYGMAIAVILCSEYYPVSHSKTQDEDKMCITEKADGHIDMCIVDSADRKALLRVSNPPMAPHLWSIERTDQLQRWVEESADEHS